MLFHSLQVDQKQDQLAVHCISVRVFVMLHVSQCFALLYVKAETSVCLARVRLRCNIKPSTKPAPCLPIQLGHLPETNLSMESSFSQRRVIIESSINVIHPRSGATCGIATKNARLHSSLQQIAGAVSRLAQTFLHRPNLHGRCSANLTQHCVASTAETSDGGTFCTRRSFVSVSYIAPSAGGSSRVQP